MLELARVEGLRILGAAEPFDGLVDPVGQREVGEEAGAVEVGIGADLEVDLGAFALQPERREEAQMIMHLGAEHHLVIAALGAAETAGHPGFEEHRASFHVPARGEVPGARQEIVEDRFRVLLHRRRLAAEKVAPESVVRIPDVDRRDVRQLMVVEVKKRSPGRERLHRQRQRSDIEKDHVARRSERGGIAVVGEILEQDRRPVPRLPVELLLMEGERVFERASEIGRQIGLDRVDVEKRQVPGFERRQMEPRRVLRDVLRAFRARAHWAWSGPAGPAPAIGSSFGGGGTASGFSTWVVVSAGGGGGGWSVGVWARAEVGQAAPDERQRAHSAAGARRTTHPPFTVSPDRCVSRCATATRRPG